MPVPEERKQQDYARYDQMSTAELEQLLRLDFQALEEDGSDLDAILYISDLLARRKGLTDSHAAWEQFQTKYRPYADGRSLYSLDNEDGAQTPEAIQAPSAPAQARLTRRLRRLAVLAAVLAALLVGGIAARAAGVDLLGVIAQWTDETFRFVSPDASSTPSPIETPSQPQSILQAAGMENRFPGIKITELDDRVSANTTFSLDDRFYSVVVVHFLQPQKQTGFFEKDDTPVEEYVHNDQTFYILSNLDTLTATSYDGAFMTIIAGSLTREEIKAVIDSIPGPQAAQNRAQLQAALAEAGQSLCLPQIPEGFLLYESNLLIDPHTQEVFWSECYVQDDQYLGIHVTKHTSPSEIIYEKDGSPVEEYVYHGVTHYIFSNLGATTAAWMVDNVEYSLQASDGAFDMKELIRSVYETS